MRSSVRHPPAAVDFDAQTMEVSTLVEETVSSELVAVEEGELILAWSTVSIYLP